MKKYTLLHQDSKIILGRTLYRIQYLRECGWSSEGGLGGYIESEENLSQSGECWVGENACVFDGAHIEGNAKVYGRSWVYQNSIVKGQASVFDNATVRQSSIVKDNARVFGSYVVEYDVIQDNQKRVKYV
jgi:carbonic anhydrase/acetyltransferase-like protein (isoleucine patch superfamily)